MKPEETQLPGICVDDKSNSTQFVKYAKISFEIQFKEKFGAARTPGAPSLQTRQIQHC